jgi:hypothetical protein
MSAGEMSFLEWERKKYGFQLVYLSNIFKKGFNE